LTAPSITREAPDRLVVTGDVDVQAAPGLLARGQELLGGDQEQSVDLSGISRIDSAGVALLLEWTREARRRHVNIRFENVPEQVLAIARVCGVEHFLPH